MVTVQERADYRAARCRHLDRFPNYDAAWERPTPETACAVYSLLKGHLDVRLEEIHPDPLVAQQLLVVALDAAVTPDGTASRRSGAAPKKTIRAGERRWWCGGRHRSRSNRSRRRCADGGRPSTEASRPLYPIGDLRSLAPIPYAARPGAGTEKCPYARPAL
jgi:hypothetical protein